MQHYIGVDFVATSITVIIAAAVFWPRDNKMTSCRWVGRLTDRQVRTTSYWALNRTGSWHRPTCLSSSTSFCCYFSWEIIHHNYSLAYPQFELQISFCLEHIHVMHWIRPFKDFLHMYKNQNPLCIIINQKMNIQEEPSKKKLGLRSSNCWLNTLLLSCLKNRVNR